MRLLILAALIAAIPAVAAENAQLPIQCGTTAEVASAVAQAGERLLVFGLGEPGTVWQYWVNLDTGTWTFVSVANGTHACLGASGHGAEPYTGPQPQVVPPGDPA